MEQFDLPAAQKIGENLAIQTRNWKSKHKFTKMLADGSFIDNEYGKIFELETTAVYQRLKIAVDNNQVDLMLRLCESLNPPYFILYVLLVARQEHEPGRYQSGRLDSIEEVKLFLGAYTEFFETDGRHHIWIGTVDNSGLLIYDQHNVIFAYGELGKQVVILEEQGFKEIPFSFPVPHAHSYNADNDKFEKQLLQHWNWTTFPLTADDTYENQ